MNKQLPPYPALSALQLYRPYLPAIVTLVGAVLVAVGLFFGQGQAPNPVFQSFRLIGAGIAAIGAFWSAHRQIQSASANKERDRKIIDLSEQLHGHLTGGDSFCYGCPYGPRDSPVFEWMFVHSGQYPLTDVSVRIHNLAAPPGQAGFLGRFVELGTTFPGKARNYGVQDARLPSHGYNLFFQARNGSWLQEKRWVDLPNRRAVANRVVRDGMPLDKPLLFEVSAEFPGHVPANEAWNDPPPYAAKSPG
jgi:hypothetical protein